MFESTPFKFQEPRSIPVILLLDTSGSMNGGNIEVLNTAVRQMLKDFASQNDNNVMIKVAIFTFGPDAMEFMPLESAANAIENYKDMVADGGTPLGGALILAKNKLIEDKEKITSRSYRPTIILVSDGNPNDSWQPALDAFCNEGRSSKCYRMSMGINVMEGTPAYEVLRQFASEDNLIFSAKDAATIKKFFKYVTLSTMARTATNNPNVIVDKTIEEIEDDDDDLQF